MKFYQISEETDFLEERLSIKFYSPELVAQLRICLRNVEHLEFWQNHAYLVQKANTVQITFKGESYFIPEPIYQMMTTCPTTTIEAFEEKIGEIANSHGLSMLLDPHHECFAVCEEFDRLTLNPLNEAHLQKWAKETRTYGFFGFFCFGGVKVDFSHRDGRKGTYKIPKGIYEMMFLDNKYRFYLKPFRDAIKGIASERLSNGNGSRRNKAVSEFYEERSKEQDGMELMDSIFSKLSQAAAAEESADLSDLQALLQEAKALKRSLEEESHSLAPSP